MDLESVESQDCAHSKCWCTGECCSRLISRMRAQSNAGPFFREKDSSIPNKGLCPLSPAATNWEFKRIRFLTMRWKTITPASWYSSKTHGAATIERRCFRTRNRKKRFCIPCVRWRRSTWRTFESLSRTLGTAGQRESLPSGFSPMTDVKTTFSGLSSRPEPKGCN